MGVPRGKGYDQRIWSRHRVCGLRRCSSETRDVRVFSPLDTAPIVFAVLWSCWPRRSQVLEASQLRLRGMRRHHFAGEVRHAHAGRKGGVRLAPRQAPPATAIFCDTLPDCSVVLGLSSNCSPFPVVHFYPFVIPHGKYPIYSHIPMLRHLWAGSSNLFGHVCSISLLWFGPAYAFVILWHTVQ